MRRRPDFLLHSGDSVYADNPLSAQVTLPDGRIWRNLLTEEKSKVAETLTEYRGYQHFGEVEIDGVSAALTVSLRDRDGISLWSTTLHP